MAPAVRTARAHARTIGLKVGHVHRQCEHFGSAPLVNVHVSRIVNRERRRFLKRPMVELLTLRAKIPPVTPKPAHSSSKLPRPFPVIHGERFTQALVEQIADPAVRHIAAQRLIGNINQWSDNPDMEGVAREKLRQLYV